MNEEYELELSVGENEFPEASPQHPSIARIKQGEGIPVIKWKPIKFGAKSNAEELSRASRDDNPETSPNKDSPDRRPNQLEHGMPIRTSKHIENKSLSQIISIRKIGESSTDQGTRKDYENLSLAEIIRRKNEKTEIDNNGNFETSKHKTQTMRQSSASSKVKNMGSNNSLNKVGGSKEVTFTPQSGIRMLCELGYMVVIEISEMKNENHSLFRARRWRASYYDGRDKESRIVGIGEAPRKSLAKESAALDFIQKMQADLTNETLPRCAVPKGCRISPSVLVAVENLCDKADMPRPSFSEDIVVINGRDKYQFTVIIGDDEFKDASYDYKYAKYGAAKKAYDALNDEGHEFTLDDIIMGDDCLDESEYCFVEGEELHIVQAKKSPPKRVLGAETYSVSATTSPVPWNEKDSNEVYGRDSPQSCVSVYNDTKRLKIASVGEYNLPPSLKKIRQRRESRLLPVGSEGSVAANDELNTTPLPCSSSEGVCSPPSISPDSSGMTTFKRTCDGLKKPIRNLTITINRERSGERGLSVNVKDSEKTEKNGENGVKEMNPQIVHETRSEFFKTCWESKLRNAVLKDMEHWKDIRVDEKLKITREAHVADPNPNPFLLKANDSSFDSGEKPFIHEVIINGFGFGEAFKLSDVGAKISILRNVRSMTNLVPTTVINNSGQGSDSANMMME